MRTHARADGARGTRHDADQSHGPTTRLATRAPRRSGHGSRPAPGGGPVRFAGLVRSAAGFLGLLVAAAVVAALVGSGLTDAPPPPGVGEPSWLVRLGIPVLRTVLDVAAMVTVGVALLAKFVGFDRPERSEPVMVPVRRLAVWSSATWMLASLACIVLLAAELDPSASLTPGVVWTYVVTIPAGKGLLLSAACGGASLWLARLTLRFGERVPAELRAGVGLFGLLPLPLTGHASNWYYHDLSMVLMELHVVAATAWAGGLGAVVLVLAKRPALLAAALPRFSKMATWCVLLVGATGVFTGLLELALSPISSLPDSLWTTRYGALVLVKLACFAAVGVIALRVRTWFLPRIAAGQRTAVALWCGWELIVLAVAFGVAVVLTRVAVTPF